MMRMFQNFKTSKLQSELTVARGNAVEQFIRDRSLGTLHLPHGIAESPQGPGALLSRAVAELERAPDGLRRFLVPHARGDRPVLEGELVVRSLELEKAQGVPALGLSLHRGLLPVMDALRLVLVQALGAVIVHKAEIVVRVCVAELRGLVPQLDCPGDVHLQSEIPVVILLAEVVDRGRVPVLCVRPELRKGGRIVLGEGRVAVGAVLFRPLQKRFQGTSCAQPLHAAGVES
mmetsp:Transcript_23446/g.55395  ORF Transcript_23446/g.55395 Transcript_23446/m.55395 type:complete len:232 (+) Transcript_23446:103-798(+)